MKNSILMLLMFVLWGCGGSGGSGDNAPVAVDLVQIDLSGTWVVVNEIRKRKANTGEYLSSEFIEFKFILEDTDDGVKFDRCWEYGGIYSPYGIKTNERFYMDSSDEGYVLVSNDTLRQISNYEDDFQPGFDFESISTLSKIAEGVEVDDGVFVLSGPVSVDERDNVCAWQVYSNIGVFRTIEVIAPYENGSILLNISLIGDITEGEYQYSDFWDVGPVKIDVTSSVEAFWDQTGSNTLAPENVIIDFSISSEDFMSATFSFLGQDGGDYAGEFEVNLSN